MGSDPIYFRRNSLLVTADAPRAPLRSASFRTPGSDPAWRRGRSRKLDIVRHVLDSGAAPAKAAGREIQETARTPASGTRTERTPASPTARPGTAPGRNLKGCGDRTGRDSIRGCPNSGAARRPI